ncbi:MAG: hypothetical protein JOZ38_04720 [Candidatus Eremiobacteraeota bacterium]|nr:hypothetical protein [Candidatus Eremiobacteraeota bacterium]
MSSQAPPLDAAAAGVEARIPAIDQLLAGMIAELALAAHAYLSIGGENDAGDLQSAEIAIDVAGAAYERVKERLRPEERLAVTQMLTETRLNFVRKRGGS